MEEKKVIFSVLLLLKSTRSWAQCNWIDNLHGLPLLKADFLLTDSVDKAGVTLQDAGYFSIYIYNLHTPNSIHGQLPLSLHKTQSQLLLEGMLTIQTSSGTDLKDFSCHNSYLRVQNSQVPGQHWKKTIYTYFSVPRSYSRHLWIE